MMLVLQQAGIALQDKDGAQMFLPGNSELQDTRGLVALKKFVLQYNSILHCMDHWGNYPLQTDRTYLVDS